MRLLSIRNDPPGPLSVLDAYRMFQESTSLILDMLYQDCRETRERFLTKPGIFKPHF